MAGEAQPRFLAGTLAHELCLPGGGRRVGVIATLLLLEVWPSIAGAGPLLVVLRAEAVERGPRFDQRAIEAEVFARDLALRTRQRHDFREKQIGHIVLQQAPLVLAVRRSIEQLLIERRVHERADHQVGLRSPAEPWIRPHRVKRLQHLPLQQRLGRNRGRPALRLDLIKVLFDRSQRLVAHPLDRPDRMISRDQHLNVDQIYKTGLGGSFPRTPSRRGSIPECCGLSQQSANHRGSH